ncbi:MAG: DUF1501 domain-containing protein, partial [Saprospiraceae bacterium]|nr:DUF1501 domain-containing protein [Saprospiraceae bacterium]
IMTFSEFGRRVEENGSLGTDHGTANTMLLMGGNLAQAGVYNDVPSLRDLDQGDLRYQIDFRRIYATILEKWLDVPPESILPGNFPGLSFLG